VHRLATGVRLIGFVAPAAAAALGRPITDIATVVFYPDAEGDATVIVSIPYDRIVQHRQYAIRNAEAITLQVMTAPAVST
jgi:hypothetical protein